MIQFSRPVRSSATQTDASRVGRSTILSAIIVAGAHTGSDHLGANAHRPPAIP